MRPRRRRTGLTRPSALDPALRRRLVDVVGRPDVVDDPDVTVGYRTDWTGRFAGPPTVVVRPGSADEVAAVVAVCRQAGAALVPQGGNTGLVGGGVPLSGEVLVSLRRLAGVTEVDGEAGQLVAGAGTTIAAVQAAATGAGWAYPVDLASRDTATLGGTIATNAGGLRVLRYGDTRRQVMSAEVVLGDGRVVGSLSGLMRDNTGYHLPSLVSGTEGTLGVVTTARVRLVPALGERVVALIAFDEVRPAVAAAGALRRATASIEALEIVLGAGVELVCDTAGLPRPFDAPHAAYLVVEVADDVDRSDALHEAVASLSAVADVAVATDSARRRQLWRYREAHTEAISTVGTPHKLDTAVPLPALAEFLDRVPDVVRTVDADATTWLFGHVGDGNVHVNVTGVAPDDERVDDAVLRLAAELGGSISAEHGVGTAKRRWVELTRSAADLAMMRAVKRALDPDGILNPNVLFPEDPAP